MNHIIATAVSVNDLFVGTKKRFLKHDSVAAPRIVPSNIEDESYRISTYCSHSLGDSPVRLLVVSSMPSPASLVLKTER